MGAYYNELDPFAAAWLRELIKAGLIADGEVDERSIIDVRPDELRGFTQCHFFAGIGGWSYALRLAGWPDEREVWTGSCPCQPFSSAGAQAGGNDARDLWPAWFRLIRECRPVVVFGEQVAAAVGHGWLDRLCDDLEREGYAVGPACLPGPCVGAFDIRQRLWFVADASDVGWKRWAHSSRSASKSSTERCQGVSDTERCGHDGELGDASRAGLQERERNGRIQQGAMESQAREAIERGGDTSGVATDSGRREVAHVSDRGTRSDTAAVERGTSFWRAADWIPCADGKARPVEPGTFPLATGIPARVGRLRGYGNSIKPQVAQAFIEAYMSTTDQRTAVSG